jgi:dihydrofolate reductase
MVSVMSLDGRLTRGDQSGTSQWASPEDQDQFAALIAQSDAVIMGRKTWVDAKPYIKPSRETLRVVVTSTPDAFGSDLIPGMLEFSNDPPATIINRLKEQGRGRVLLAGGAQTNASFLDAGVVDELVTTIEPAIFGDGRPLVASLRSTVRLSLKSSEALNSGGTLLLRHLVHR